MPLFIAVFSFERNLQADTEGNQAKVKAQRQNQSKGQDEKLFGSPHAAAVVVSMWARSYANLMHD